MKGAPFHRGSWFTYLCQRTCRGFRLSALHRVSSVSAVLGTHVKKGAGLQIYPEAEFKAFIQPLCRPTSFATYFKIQCNIALSRDACP